jgi:hypothetical protein
MKQPPGQAEVHAPARHARHQGITAAPKLRNGAAWPTGSNSPTHTAEAIGRRRMRKPRLRRAGQPFGGVLPVVTDEFSSSVAFIILEATGRRCLMGKVVSHMTMSLDGFIADRTTA